MKQAHPTHKFTMKYVGLLCIIILCAAFFAPAESQAVEIWQCTLDLHQGDTGTLEFSRTGSDITGKTIVHRGENTFENIIKGTWTGSTIEFWRELTPSSSGQPFRGIAVSTDGNKVKMAGRFANQFAGVWSADCEPKVKLLRVPPMKVLPR
jgi:hypothetical protein